MLSRLPPALSASRAAPLATLAGRRAFALSSVSKVLGLTSPGDLKVRTSILPGREPLVCDTAEEALGPFLKTDAHVFIHAGAATPQVLIDGMIKVAKAGKLRNVRTYHMHLEGKGPVPIDDPEAAECITPVASFVGANLRRQIEAGDAMYMPIHLRDLPMLFRRRVVVPDVCLLHVSPPDRHGYCTLGTSVDWARSAMEHGKHLVAMVNEHMPRVRGDGGVHWSQLDAVVRHNVALPAVAPKPLSPEEIEIGKNIAALVPDGATLQMGIGSVPDAALAQMGGHKNLGIHTEMFSDGAIPLLEKGVINNAMKSSNRGLTISSFVTGSQKLFDFVNDNPSVELRDVAYTNNVEVIASQHQMIGINSCIEMDITGQAASGSIGKRIFSGFGGQVDFLTGASACPNGRGILAMPSRSAKGAAKIVPTLQQAAGVVTTRAMVQYVVTEHGSCNLFGKALPERARMLIDLAHPDDREMLEREAFSRFGRAFR